MADIEQPMVRIRLYREGGDMWNRPIIHKKKEEEKKKKKKRKKRRKRKREDTCIVADEQPSTLGEPDFRKVLVTGVHRGNYKAFF
jgi:hypothetical protein